MGEQLTPEAVERLVAVAKAATQGSWSNFEGERLTDVHSSGGNDDVVHWTGFSSARTTWKKRLANAAHIAAFDPPTCLALLSRIRADAERIKALEEAARDLIAQRSDTFTARNGRKVGIEGDPVSRTGR